MLGYDQKCTFLFGYDSMKARYIFTLPLNWVVCSFVCSIWSSGPKLNWVCTMLQVRLLQKVKVSLALTRAVASAYSVEKYSVG